MAICAKHNYTNFRSKKKIHDDDWIWFGFFGKQTFDFCLMKIKNDRSIDGWIETLLTVLLSIFFSCEHFCCL